MAKLVKNNKQEQPLSHNEKAYSYLEQHLPYTYVDLTVEWLIKKGHKSPNKALIRNVRNKTILRNDILLALVEVATENKNSIERIKSLVSES
ncbi:hypothetical protein [Flavobacterium sp. HTF]|uniref:hypothetical protein n=1 Tax=Flavobacterium sp. HTF TaxID=2170732 RepID=UPI000D5C86B3|nr:hypothetical protein [Flavobacterium sp. HTF]PWB22390.1 hypothetical protein DCO46_17350 [Flavobacterium sp. HTF]